MGHLSLQKPHRRLRERLDMHPIGCPETPGIIELLEAIFTPEQAAFVCTLPMKFFPIREACRRSGLSRKRAQELLDGLCDLGVVLDFERKGRRLYVVAPTLTGFLEFLFMRRRKNIDQPSLAVMMDKYLHQNVGIFRDMIGNVSMGRALVHEEKVLPRDYTEVLDYEKASFLIGEAKAVDTGKLQHLIFDNPEQWYGKAASRLVGSILGLEPSKRILASKQVRSAVLSGLMKGDATTQLLKKLF